MRQLQERIKYSFKDAALLETALSHSSYANENRGSCESNERLEFLGDSILGMVVAEKLYTTYPDMPEGQMTKLRAELVCEQSLYEVAKELDFGKSLRLGKGEEHTGGRGRPSILADCVEAVIAAMYLDGGIEPASAFIHERILSGIDAKGNVKRHLSDCKTALQELIQKKSDQVLEYKLLSESGPDHCKTFTMGVWLNGKQIGTGTGRTKKEAEQSAARCALEAMDR